MRALRTLCLLFAFLAWTSSGSPAIGAVCDGISDAPASPLTTVRVPGTYLRPLFITAPPGDTTRLFIVEQDGTIRIVKNGALLATAFLDISALTRSPADGADNEEGLLGLAFHPNYAANGIFFVYHTEASGSNLLVRYHRDAGNPDLADPATREVLETFLHPSFGNHNGGMRALAPPPRGAYVRPGAGAGGDE